MRKTLAIQVASHAAVSCASFSVAVLAVDLGGTALDVGAIAAGTGLAMFLSSWWFGRAADVHGRRRVLQGGLAVAALAALLHLLARDPATLLAARAAFGLAAGSFPAALTSLAFDESRKLGAFTGLGALGTAAGVLVGGAVAVVAHGGVFVVASALLALAFLLSLLVKYPREHHHHVPVFPVNVLRANAAAYSAVVIRHAGAMAAWCVFPLLLREMGASLFEIGLASAVNGLAQFALMSRMDRGSPRALVVGGSLASALAFALLLAAPSVGWALAAQPVLALGWAMLYVGALRLVLARNVARATATGLLQSSVHLANVLGPVVGGLVAWQFGLHAAMWLGVAGGLVAVPVFLHELKTHPSVRRAPGGAPARHAANRE